MLHMLKIRLQRVGRKHEPSFRVVLTDSKNSTKSGKFLEVLGSYDPRKKTEQFDALKIKHWISKGAKPTDTLHNIFIDQKIVEGKKINVLPKKSPIIKEKETPPEVPSAEPELKKEEGAIENKETVEVEKQDGENLKDSAVTENSTKEKDQQKDLPNASENPETSPEIAEGNTEQPIG